GVFDVRAVRITDLRPAGDPRPDRVALVVIGDLGAQLLDELRSFRTRPDEAHLTSDDIDELRQLVQSVLAQESAPARDARVVLDGPAGDAVGFGVLPHRAKLQQLEDASVEADASLPEQDRTR